MRTLLSFVLALCVLPLIAQPAGTSTPEWYVMNSYLQTSRGTEYVFGLVNQVCYGEDENDIYFRTLFPAQYRELWIHGVIDQGYVSGPIIVFDPDEVVAVEEFFDDYGQSYTYELRVGEPVFNENDEIAYIKPAQLKIVSPGYFEAVDDFNSPDHPIALFGEDEYGIQLFDYIFCPDFRPYPGKPEIEPLPADAVITSYNYDYNNYQGNPTRSVGHVAVKGNNYYFDMLTPDQGAWIKGQRVGNRITFPNDQLMSLDMLYLLFCGYTTDWHGHGSMTPFTMTIDDQTGIIQQTDPDNQFAVTHLLNGSMADYNYKFVLTPYDENLQLVPSDPYGVQASFDYLSYGQYGIIFYQNATSNEGINLSTDQLGYYIYVNNELYTFKRSIYPYISENEMTFIPYGYSDSRQWDIFCDGIYNYVLLSISGFETLGVQAVYRASNGQETRSNLINVDRNQNVTIVPATAIESVSTPSTHDVDGFFDLYGRRVDGNHRGLIIRNGVKMVN
ncbi:MAG: hypothetical protein KBT20_03365 [Bacteroidales bacterium]|nr:hypothetical protein [Candidatus Liminaster caballi]